MRERIRYLHYSIRTEESYLYWIRFFIRWSGVRHPREMGADEVRAFLTFLASPAIGAHRSQRREAVLRETPPPSPVRTGRRFDSAMLRSTNEKTTR